MSRYSARGAACEALWALVTGAAKRIGREIALELAATGFDIIVHYNSSHDEAVKTAHAIEALGRKACLAELDLSNLLHVGQLIPALAAEFGPLAVLVNNASLFIPGCRRSWRNPPCGNQYRGAAYSERSILSAKPPGLLPP